VRTTEATRYARSAAAVAVLLAALVGAVYLRRSWQAAQARKQVPPSVPPTVQQRSAVFSFSKVEQDRTLFTVRASRATEFKEGKRNLLEDVWITIYGRTGQRYDNIHTQSCNYLADTGYIVCAGEVELDLESAQEARESPGGRVLHVSTRNVSFDRNTGEARTDQPVTFRFPYGEGRAVGVRYSSREGAVRLARDVEMKLARSPSVEPVALTGSSLEYRRDTRTLRLLSPARATQAQRELKAAELSLELDAELRAKRLLARGHPEVHSSGPGEQTVISADEFLALFHPDGWTERVLAVGEVRGRSTGASGEESLAAERAEVEMLPELNHPRVLTATGGVTAQAKGRDTSRRLETAALRLFFIQAKSGARNGKGKRPAQRLDHAETLAPATIGWQSPTTVDGKTLIQTTRMRAQKVAAEYGARNALRTLEGHDGVEVERSLPGRFTQVTSSRELVAKFGPNSDWSEMDQTGNVRFREGDRAGQADRAHAERTSDSVTLTGSVVLTDRETRTTAPFVFFNQRTGEIRAEGGVRSTDLALGQSSASNLVPQPTHISSERLLANSSTGRAIYSGSGRLWQRDSVIEADLIELARATRVMVAKGHVRAVFPQAAGALGGGSGSPPGRTGAQGKSPIRPGAAQPELWRARADTLTYWGSEGRARLEHDVQAQSSQVVINAQTLDLYFSSAGSLGGSPHEGGALELNRAVASGGATVREGERRGVADRAEYFATEGKVVLSGGRPTIYDASRGTTTGRQLTFFFANDTIIVDSEEGSRTLTRHRVEK
jgi:LPS export ABC transporter protein LptC